MPSLAAVAAESAATARAKSFPPYHGVSATRRVVAAAAQTPPVNAPHCAARDAPRRGVRAHHVL